MVGQGKLGTKNEEARLKYQATENFTPNIFSIYEDATRLVGKTSVSPTPRKMSLSSKIWILRTNKIKIRVPR